MSYLLQELAELDTYWRKLALSICRDELLADDLVQDMYLKVTANPPKFWTKRYIYRVLHSVFIDYKRSQRGRIDIDHIEVSYDPTNYDTDELTAAVQKGLSDLDEDDKIAILTNMDDTVRGTAKKLGYSAYKLWSKNKQTKKELSERDDMKAAYSLLKKGEL
jgi:DNA-directed RNA polymerase specialized sigma24 family protein